VPVPLFDLSRFGTEVEGAIEAAVLRVLRHRNFILGPEVAELEREIEAYLGRGQECHAIGISSGTDALLALLMASGIGPGDAVITTPYTFFATASCIHRVGAEILFCDIDPSTFLMDPVSLGKVLGGLSRDGGGTLRTPRGNAVRAIMPIHLFGTCCDMDSIAAIAAEYSLPVIEDAAQVLGTDYPGAHGPLKAGLISEMSYFSFYPSKNLGAAGDAGMAVCRDAKLAERIRLVRNHGMEDRYYHKIVGGNFRIDGIQAAILRAKLPFLDGWNATRRANASRYRELFASAGLLGKVSLPSEPFASSGLRDHHIYHQFVIRIPGRGIRDTVMASMGENKIGCAIYYPVPLHLQECFAYLGHQSGDFPQSELAADESLALPIFPGLTLAEQEEVVGGISKALALVNS
jgi:dTDP-4-amino-4,6-dideoxygalactose transaminase